MMGLLRRVGYEEGEVLGSSRRRNKELAKRSGVQQKYTCNINSGGVRQRCLPMVICDSAVAYLACVLLCRWLSCIRACFAFTLSVSTDCSTFPLTARWCLRSICRGRF